MISLVPHAGIATTGIAPNLGGKLDGRVGGDQAGKKWVDARDPWTRSRPRANRFSDERRAEEVKAMVPEAKGKRLPPGVVVHTLESARESNISAEFRGRPVPPSEDELQEEYFALGTAELMLSTIRQIPESVLRNVRGFQITVVA